VRYSGGLFEEVSGAVGREVADNLMLAVSEGEGRDLAQTLLDGGGSNGAYVHALRTCSALLRSEWT
jgi:hypothetical protein